ncbi:MAG TPA: aspartate carbamoyltransferase catalytic subunit [Pseudogracilibacillus sp.]|nr:aspartate carbamoyltransferase catalytic subunit [Pseudogracilibacillus sp.]
MKHFISIEDLTVKEVYDLLRTIKMYREDEYKLTKQVFVANLFFEPSTRTKTSFVVAERKLGIEDLEFATQTSSMKKGETLYDTAKTFEAVGANCLVIRHEDDEWSKGISKDLNIPIINAGSGKKDHPTQSLLDLYTIYQEFGYFTGLKVAIAGDIKHSRVARSNAQLLAKLGVEVYFTAADEFKETEFGYPYISMDEAAETCDVVMLLRIQHERHEAFSGSIINYLEEYGLTKKRESKMKKHAIILHPGPVNRGVEIDPELVECKRSRISKQIEYGVYTRMAILTKQLLEWEIIDESHIKKCPKPILATSKQKAN